MKNLIFCVSFLNMVSFLCSQNAWSFEVSYPNYKQSVEKEKIGNNTFFYGTTKREGFVQYQFLVPHDSVYELSALVIAKDSQSNSFLVKIDDEEPIQWSLEKSSYQQWRTYPVTLFLTKGDHEITFFVDEPNTKISISITKTKHRNTVRNWALQIIT